MCQAGDRLKSLARDPSVLGARTSLLQSSSFASVFPTGSPPLTCHTLSPSALRDQAGPQGASLRDSI